MNNDTEFQENNAAATSIAVPEDQPTTGSTAGLRDRQLPDITLKEKPESVLIDSIPEDVKKNIVGYDRLVLEQTILKILSAPNAVYTTNRIILILAHKYNRADDRSLIQARIRALISQGLVKKEERTRGIYSITESGRSALGDI